MSGNKEKVACDVMATKLYIQLCLKQWDKGEQNGTTLSKKGWRDIESEFNRRIGRKYGKT